MNQLACEFNSSFRYEALGKPDSFVSEHADTIPRIIKLAVVDWEYSAESILEYF